MKGFFRKSKVQTEDSHLGPCKDAQAIGQMLDDSDASSTVLEVHPAASAEGSSAAAHGSAEAQGCDPAQPHSSLASSMATMLDPEKTYPYVVIRYMPAVYGSVPIEFVSDLSQSPQHEHSYLIEMSTPYRDGRLTPEARQAVLGITEAVFNRVGRRLRVCAVLGENDCVYFELDGSRDQSTCVPYMTMGLGSHSKSPNDETPADRHGCSLGGEQ